MEGNKVGRPLKFKTKEELDSAISKYFNEREKDRGPLTMTGLGLAIGLSRQDLVNYSNRDEFFDSIKNAKAICENYAETRLYEKFTPGVIFNLKNNYGWEDKTVQDMKVEDKVRDDVKDILKEIKNMSDEEKSSSDTKTN